MSVARILLCASLLLPLSGCVGSSGESGITPSASWAPDEETGAVSGIVIDSENLPVPFANVALLPGSLSTTTEADGRFLIGSVPPGDYTLHTIKLGYEAAAKRVTIVIGETVQVTVSLAPIPIAEPRIEVLGPFPGYMQCRMSTPLSSGACGFIPVYGNTPVTSIWTNDKVLWDFGKFTSDDWQNIVFESRWRPSTAASNGNMMQVFSYDKRPGPTGGPTRAPAPARSSSPSCGEKTVPAAKSLAVRRRSTASQQRTTPCGPGSRSPSHR